MITTKNALTLVICISKFSDRDMTACVFSCDISHDLPVFLMHSREKFHLRKLDEGTLLHFPTLTSGEDWSSA